MNNNQVNVDIIIPCYRYGHFLRECVESVLNQTGVNVRILILDDASPDNTPEIANDLTHQDARVFFKRHHTNKGHIATYNEGIEWVSAKYMLLISADDYLLPNALSRATTMMENNSNVGFVFGNFLILSNKQFIPYKTFTNDIIKDSKVLGGREFVELSKSTNIVRTPTAVVRTELQKKIGGYRADLPHSGDMEMWLRFSAHGSIGFINENQAVYRQHGENMSLSYDINSSIPDLEQRKQCLDIFFTEYGYAFFNIDYLRKSIFSHLANNAITLASGAFNEQKFEISDQLTSLAFSIAPRVKYSRAYLFLFIKRIIGFKVWMWLYPITKLKKLLDNNNY